MSWIRLWNENIKKRLCRYLLQHYLGQFLEEKLTLDQLTIDLYNGKCIVNDVSLDVQALNELSTQQKLPFWFVEGSLAQVCVSVPWTALLSESSYVEICGLSITVRPKHRVDSGASMLESMWNSFSSSMQMAEDCLKQDMEQDAAPLEGLEKFAQMIESILSRIKVKFEDLKVRLEHVPKESRTGVAAEVHVKELTYLDEAGQDATTSPDEDEKQQTSAFSIKKFSLEGISVYTDEFYLPSMEASVWESQDGIEHNLILAAKLSARQDIRLKVKAAENISGAKVSLEVLLGSLNCFLSPRQFHAMQELISGLLSPGEDQDRPAANRQKPMGAQDFQLVEQGLQQILMSNETQPGPSGHLQAKQGWSVAEDSDEDEQFYTMAKSNMKTSMGASSCANSSVFGDSMASSMTASTASVSPFTHKCLAASGLPDLGSGKKKSHHHHMLEEETASADQTSFSIRISSVSLILLQEDVLVASSLPTSHMRQITASSKQQMIDLATAFFKHIDAAMRDGFGVKDFQTAQKVLREATKPNHLRLLAAPITIEGTDKLGVGGSQTEGRLTAARFEIVELLNDQPGQDSDLLVFQDSKAFSSYPDVQVSFNHKVKSNRGMTCPKTELNFVLQSCLVEVDLSLADRISSITNPMHTICHYVKKRQSPLDNPINVYEAVEPASSPDSRVDISVKFPKKVSVKLRFPCPDLRPLSDMERVPWWQRNVRDEWLLICLNNAEFKSSISSRELISKYEVECTDMQVIFQDKSGENDVPVLICDKEEAAQSLPNNGRGFGLIRLIVVVTPTNSQLSEMNLAMDESSEESFDPSASFTFEKNNRRKDPSPFSSVKVLYESDTQHVDVDETYEVVKPGDKKEITDFIDYATKQSKIHIDLVLPNATLTIPSKHFYELLYNRITTDFMLWEPSRPSNAAPLPDLMSNMSIYTTAFSMCKSGIHLEPDSESSDSEDYYYSVHESRQRAQTLKHSRVPLGQSKVTINLKINEGTILLSSPARDAANGVIPNQKGELKLLIGEGSLFVASECRGDPNLSYICIQANQAALYHAGLVSADVGCASLLPTIIQTVPGLNMKPQEKVGCGGQSLDMLCVAIKIHMKQPGALKMIKVATGVRGATLHHRVVPGPQSWLSEMIDMLDVIDYPVPGYLPPRVITELHLHLWNCAVDYRPLYLPLRCVVTMDSFSVSSNLAAKTRSSSLRFVAERGSLFISDKTPTSRSPELAKDYVSVLTLGCFELSLRLSDDPRAPKVDLRASSKSVHLRTCADSCRALAELLSYFASDGDLIQPTNVSSRSTTPLQSDRGSQTSLSTQTQTDQVNSLMEEAMQDNHALEHQLEENQEGTHNVDNVAAAEEFIIDTSRVPSDDEDFCILGEDPGTGIIPQHGEPEVRKLCTGPIKIVENHFGIPLRRMDLLETPKSFPNPELRYTICDLSLVWHLYGGCDFQPAEKKSVRMKVDSSASNNSPIRSSGASPSISFSKSAPSEVQFNSPKPKTNVPQKEWQERGGPGRDHDVLMEFQFNKVRFRHEVYPENANVASRQVFLVQSMEARDRLASSAINKFMYLHSSEAQPKQAHANMVVIKAVNLRTDINLPYQQECCLKVSLQPLRFNIDQDSLLFLCSYFSDLATVTPSQSSEDISSIPQAPVMLVNCPASPTKVLTEELPLVPEMDTEDTKGSQTIFFKNLLFSPDVPIRIDYQGKRVDMSHGPLAGILMGLAQLNCSEVTLKRISYRYGLLGVDKLVAHMMNEWLNDIKKNQLPSVLGGVGPMHSIMQLFQGIRDLVLLPMEQYQRDGRIVRGLQRGAHSFTSSTAIAALELTNRLVNAVQITAETAYDMLSPGPSMRQRRMQYGTDRRRRDRHAPPADIREGVSNAIMLVQEGLGDTARNFVAVASAEHEEKGVYGAVGGVLRQIPPTVVTPVILASEATSAVLGGLRSQLAPDARREAQHKWRDGNK